MTLQQILKEQEEKIRNLRLTFIPSSVIQKENPAMEIPEIDTGILDKESEKRIIEFIQSYNAKIIKAVCEEVLKITKTGFDCICSEKMKEKAKELIKETKI